MDPPREKLNTNRKMKQGIILAISNPSVTGPKGSIRQEYYQSFIKRIVGILWATIAIPIRSGFQ